MCLRWAWIVETRRRCDGCICAAQICICANSNQINFELFFLSSRNRNNFSFENVKLVARARGRGRSQSQCTWLSADFIGRSASVIRRCAAAAVVAVVVVVICYIYIFFRRKWNSLWDLHLNFAIVSLSAMISSRIIFIFGSSWRLVSESIHLNWKIGFTYMAHDACADWRLSIMQYRNLSCIQIRRATRGLCAFSKLHKSKK